MILVSVIIPHYNDLKNLELCLARLAAQGSGTPSFEVIVADNNSRCGLAAVEAVAKDRARVVPAPEQGAGPARNAGAASARGEILAFIDSDCVPAPDWIARGVAGLAGTDFIGGRVDVLPLSPGRLNAYEAFETVFAFDFESYIKHKNFTGSGNMFVRREIFEAVGGFRRTVSEDMEWSHRAIAKGYRLAYVPDLVVGHPARRNWAELSAKWRRLVRESFGYHQQCERSLFAWLVTTAVVMVSPLAHTVKVLRSPKLGSARDRLNAIGVLFAIRAYRAWAMADIALRSRSAALEPA